MTKKLSPSAKSAPARRSSGSMVGSSRSGKSSTRRGSVRCSRSKHSRSGRLAGVPVRCREGASRGERRARGRLGAYARLYGGAVRRSCLAGCGERCRVEATGARRSGLAFTPYVGCETASPRARVARARRAQRHTPPPGPVGKSHSPCCADHSRATTGSWPSRQLAAR